MFRVGHPDILDPRPRKSSSLSSPDLTIIAIDHYAHLCPRSFPTFPTKSHGRFRITNFNADVVNANCISTNATRMRQRPNHVQYLLRLPPVTSPTMAHQYDPTIGIDNRINHVIKVIAIGLGLLVVLFGTFGALYLQARSDTLEGQ